MDSAGLSSITLNQPIEASGTMHENTLLAREIELKTPSDEKQRLAAIVERVDLEASSLTLLGQQVRVTASTILEDERDDDPLINLSSLAPGVDFVSVDLFVASDGILEASKLERERLESKPINHAEIAGFIQSVDTVTAIITAVNVEIDVSAVTNLELILGDRIEIEGVYDATSGILTATEAESDNETEEED
jgi:hypothetical protein